MSADVRKCQNESTKSKQNMLIVLIFLFIYVNNFVSAKHTGIYGNVEKNCSRILGALLGHMKDRQCPIILPM